MRGCVCVVELIMLYVQWLFHPAEQHGVFVVLRDSYQLFPALKDIRSAANRHKHTHTRTYMQKEGGRQGEGD